MGAEMDAVDPISERPVIAPPLSDGVSREFTRLSEQPPPAAPLPLVPGEDLLKQIDPTLDRPATTARQEPASIGPIHTSEPVPAPPPREQHADVYLVSPDELSRTVWERWAAIGLVVAAMIVLAALFKAGLSVRR